MDKAMPPLSLSQTQFEVIMESLEHIFKVLDGVDYNCDSNDPKNCKKTAPYAIGYTRESVKNLMETVQAIHINN